MRKSISLPLVAFSLLLVVAILFVTSFDIAINVVCAKRKQLRYHQQKQNQNDQPIDLNRRGEARNRTSRRTRGNFLKTPTRPRTR